MRGMKKLSAAVGLSTVVFLAGLTAVRLEDPDYTTVYSVTQRAAKVHEAKVFIAEAIESAQKETGGKASSARLEAGVSGDVYRVMVYLKDRAKDVTVNASTGAIESSVDSCPLPGDPVSGEWTVTDSGLKYYEIKKGDGPTPANAQTQVRVHYSGWLVDGSKFDSSVDRGQPAVFPLDRVISGWTEGVGSMKVGGKRKLIIPYNLAYGEAGRPGAIPPKATLVFDVELLEIVN